MTSLVLTVTETLRYRGKLGQWSWVAHRAAGLGTLLFVILHVIDTSWATFYPELYAKAILAYKTPLFTVGEFGLVAAVVYHALNGFRVAMMDFRPQMWKYQANAAKLVWAGTLVILVPVFVIMFGHVVNYYNDRVSVFDLGLDKVIDAQLPFAIGAVVVLAIALVVALVASVLPGYNKAVGPKKTYKKNALDTFMWRFMRISGVFIIPLVFGHLLMVHVINGVFDITQMDHVPIGTTLGPNNIPMIIEGKPITDKEGAQASAERFVNLRWNTIVAGVFVWRLYDAALLMLIVLHGFWGLRYVITDYFKNRIVGRTLKLAALGLAVGLIVVGTLALIQTVPATAEKFQKDRASQMVNSASQK